MSTIKLPDSWSEVTIGQYQEIVSIETKDPIRRWIEIIAILSDEDPEKIKLMDAVNFTKSVNHLVWITSLPSDKIFKEEIIIDNVIYKFQERLQDLSVGEWIDLEAYNEDTNFHLHKIFAILYRDDKEYTSKNLDERAKLFKEHLFIGDVYAALVFFSLIGKESITTIKDFLTLEIVGMTGSEEEMKKMAAMN